MPYAALREHGWDPFIVTPAGWRHEYAARRFPPEVLPELSGRVLPRRIILAGRVQRHLYLASVGRLVAKLKPDAAFLEAEPTSVAAMQWSEPLARSGIPFGVQVAENLERSWPLPARFFRKRTLSRAAFVAARSPTSADLATRLRPGVRAIVIPHHVPAWPLAPRQSRADFVIGFAGRLVPEKGIGVLIDAVAGLERAVVRLVGNGPMKAELEQQAARNSVRLEVCTTIAHEDMGGAYAGFDVLVLPSLSTPTWVEQFGRVLVEALWCGVPVIGSDSGEIPWVIESTGGGRVFPEGDAIALRELLVRLRDSEDLGQQLAERGRARVQELFSVEAVTRKLDVALREACRGGAAAGLRRERAGQRVEVRTKHGR